MARIIITDTRFGPVRYGEKHYSGGVGRFGINGKFYEVPVGIGFEPDDALLDAITNADIKFGPDFLSGSIGMSVSARSFNLSSEAGDFIANISNPFTGATTYEGIGASGPLIVSSTGSVFRGLLPADPSFIYSLKVRATSADGEREVAETFDFNVINDLGPIDPKPEFIEQPSIFPLSGIAGQTIFTANDGVIVNATGTQRRWLLGGTSIGTGITVGPIAANLAGTLILEVTADGSGGQTVSSASAEVVSAQLPTVDYAPAVGYEGNVLPSATYASQTVGTVTGLDVGYSVSVSGGLGLFSVTGGNTIKLTGSVNYNVAYTIPLHINLVNASGNVVGTGIDIEFTVIQGSVSSPRWITPLGAGTKDGATLANAAPIAGISSQVALAGNNGIVNIIEGDYVINGANLATIGAVGSSVGNQTLIQSADASGNYKPLGVKMLGTRRIANGNLWTLPSDPEQLTYLAPEQANGGNAGNNFFTISGSTRVTFRGFDFSHCAYPFIIKNSTAARGIVIEDCHFYDHIRCIEMTNTTDRVDDLTIRNNKAIGFSRAAVRLNGIVNNVLIENFSANSGRQIGDVSAGSTAFCVILDLTGTITNWTIRGTETDRNSPNFMVLENAHMDLTNPNANYLNGDGIVTNAGAYNGLVENVLCRGCTDGGVDIKGRKTYYRNVWCEDNKRNFRCWIESSYGEDPWQTFENCHSVNPTVKRNKAVNPSGTIPIHWGLYGSAISDMLWRNGCTATHDPLLPGCAGAIACGVECGQATLRFETNGLIFNGQNINSEADMAAYTGDGQFFTQRSGDNTLFFFGLNLSNTAKALVPNEQRSAVTVENQAYSRQFTADRPFTARLKAASNFGKLSRTGLFVADPLYLNYTDLGGNPAVVPNLEFLSPERNKDTFNFSIAVLDDGANVGESITYWVAPTARGTGDGSNYANAAARSAIGTFINRIVNENVPGIINLDADSGAYTQPATGFDVIKLPTDVSKKIIVRGRAADDTPKKAIFNGNRPDRTNGDGGDEAAQSYFITFQNFTSADQGFIEFRDLTMNNFGNGVWRVKTPVSHWGIYNCNFYNVYRVIENPSGINGNAEGAARISYLDIDNINLLKCERGFWRLQYGSHHVKMTNFVLDGAERWGDQFMSIITLQSQRIDGLDNWHDITLEDGVIKNAIMNSDAKFTNGDGLDGAWGRDWATTYPENLVINRVYVENTSDGGIDHKSANCVVTDLTTKNCKRSIKDWNPAGPSKPSRYVRWTSIEPRKNNSGSADVPLHIIINRANHLCILDDCRIRNRGECNLLFDYVENKFGQVYQINGWDKFNIKDSIRRWLTRGGTTAPTSDAECRIEWNPPLPTSQFTIVPKPGFNGLVVPEGTAIGTAVGTVVFDEGSGSARVVSGSSAFIVDQATKEIRVAQALDYSVQPVHEFIVRGVYGIVGTNPVTGLPGDPADDTTWQCYMGPTSKDKMVVVAVSDGSNENAATTAFMTSFGSAAPSTQWRRFIDMFQNSLDEFSLRTKQDAFPLGYGWSQEVAVRDALNRHHGVIEGSITWEAATGSFKSAGGVSTNRVNWPTYTPGAGGETMTQNAVNVLAEIMEDLNTGSTQFSVAGTNNLVPRTSGTAGSYRVTAAGPRSYNLPNSGATMGRAWWRLFRNSSSQMQLIRAGAVINTSAIASVALSTGTQWGGANQNKGFLRSWGGILTTEEINNVYRLFNRAAAMASQFV